ncbi:EcsC family protein [Austwickia chelonae]|uniref:EcsC family protein n=1 Tax=Austwickia chelonae TaxID=100225 RepID=UPI000E226767|nr:EcsC family protein [Austwickia chelonae]
MGVFDKQGGSRPTQDVAAPEGVTGSAAKLVERLLTMGIEGKGHFESAEAVARAAQAKKGSAEAAVDAVVRDHLKICAASGFVTGLGGFITLPVALPANVLGFYIVVTRMSAAVAYLRGYDLARPEVRSAVLLSLVGADADDVLRKAGYASSGRVATMAAERLPGPVLMAVNKGVGFRLVTQFGKKSLTKLGRGVPLAGGLLGAGLDGFMCRRIASHVRTEFPRRDRPMTP